MKQEVSRATVLQWLFSCSISVPFSRLYHLPSSTSGEVLHPFRNATMFKALKSKIPGLESVLLISNRELSSCAWPPQALVLSNTHWRQSYFELLPWGFNQMLCREPSTWSATVAVIIKTRSQILAWALDSGYYRGSGGQPGPGNFPSFPHGQWPLWSPKGWNLPGHGHRAECGWQGRLALYEVREYLPYRYHLIFITNQCAGCYCFPT